MRSHGLRQLVDDKSVASCHQTCGKLIIKTCHPQVWNKLFQYFVTSLQMTRYKLLILSDLLQRDEIEILSTIMFKQAMFWLCTRRAVVYSRFQLTFHCNIPNFVAKFGRFVSKLKSSFQNSHASL